MPLKVQLPLPSVGLGLYQLGVHIRAKKPFYFSFTSAGADEEDENFDVHVCEDLRSV